MMRALDLFSAAAGGWSLGLHRAGFITVAACEIVEWRRILYAENNPHVRLYDDVRALTAARLVSDLGFLPDIIVGSPPCQDISSANTKGRGIEGERSGLYLEAVRLVGDCRPRWFAFENSANLRTRGADRLLLLLETLGYACEPCVVAAENVGANHVRKRSWLIGYDPGQLADAAHQRRGTRPGDVQGARREADWHEPADDDAPRCIEQAADPLATDGMTDGAGGGAGSTYPLRMILATPRKSDAERGGRGDVLSQLQGHASRHAGMMPTPVKPNGGRRLSAQEIETGRRANGAKAQIDTPNLLRHAAELLPTPTKRDSRMDSWSPAYDRRKSPTMDAVMDGAMTDRAPDKWAGARALAAMLRSRGLTGTAALPVTYGWMMGFPPGWLARALRSAVHAGRLLPA
ncbi:DNA cytosine methyltransferase [Caballeronia sp. CLC5]|uniref:DNA cytosine methyltransferase n=2 Tax=unclassified Caballeronia TaxID=2646786 RepID=UPI001F40D0F4|nr:DNA cytosine methyltransferase [Caballeronia sp. CLC5]MCE4568622.1 DNA cytosine methyltransferase [Caballeronia sp. CLC5]